MRWRSGPRSSATQRRWRLGHRPVMWRVSVLLSAVALAGCAASTTPMPDVDGRLAIRVSREQLSSRRFGTHQIPGTSIYVSGHQGGSEIGMQFGPIGLLAGHAAAQSTGETKIKEAEPHLGLDIPGLAERMLADELARRPDTSRFVMAGGMATAGTLEIKPYVVINFVGHDQARLWVVLQTALKDASQKWKLQYIAGVGEPRRIAGQHGWAAEDGALLRQAVDRNLRLATDLLLRDTSRALPRDSRRLATVHAHWLWMKEPRTRLAIVLDETEQLLAVLPCVYEKDADGFVHTGMTILDAKAVTVNRASDTTQPCLGKHVDVN